MNESASIALAPTSAPTTSAHRWSPALVPSLMACFVGSAIAVAIIHSIDPYFKFADLPELGISPSAELVVKHNAAQYAFHSHNLALNMGVLGLCLGAAIGLIATHQRRTLSSIVGGLAGLSGGAIAGYAVGAMVAKAIIVSEDQSLIQSTGLHFACWAGMLACIAFAVGAVQAGLYRAVEYLLLSILLGFIVAIAFNVLSSALLPNSNLLLVIPQTLTERLVWMLVTSLALGLGLHLCLRPKPVKPDSELRPGQRDK